jgi:hypothetical protein
MTICTSSTKADKPCSAQTMRGSAFCYRHSPDILEDDKRAASASGGKRRQVLSDAGPITLRSVDSIVSLLESNINSVRTGQLDPKVSNAVVQNLNVLLKVYELAITDTRVRKLEKHAGIESPNELIYSGGN